MDKKFVYYAEVTNTALMISKDIIEGYSDNPNITNEITDTIKQYSAGHSFFPKCNVVEYYPNVVQWINDIKALNTKLTDSVLHIANAFNNVLSNIGCVQGPDGYKDAGDNRQHLELLGMIVKNVYKGLSNIANTNNHDHSKDSGDNIQHLELLGTIVENVYTELSG